MAIGPAITKPWADKCLTLCKLISKSMHVNSGHANDRIAMKLGYHRLKWVLQSQIMPYKVRWGWLFVSSLPDIERITQGASAPHKQWPPRPRLSSLRPEKRPTFCWWIVQMHSIQRQCYILTKFMLVTKSTCNFSSTRIFFSWNKFICAGITWTQTWF